MAQHRDGIDRLPGRFGVDVVCLTQPQRPEHGNQEHRGRHGQRIGHCRPKGVPDVDTQRRPRHSHLISSWAKNSKIAGKYGLRHRAAVSITEKTDAVAIVVSEESGKISYIKNGEFIGFNSCDELLKLVEKDIS